MLSEFSLGRSTKRNSMRAFSKLAPGTKWKWVGYMGILCAFIILSFYCVIAGWSLEFLKESVLTRFHDRTPEQVAAAFDGQRLATDRMDARIHRGFGFHRLLGNRKGNRTVQ